MKYLSLLCAAACLFFISCSEDVSHNDPIPEHETFILPSTHVNEVRTINVWLPDNYDSTTDSLTVLYMLDGGIEEDFPHVANTISELVSTGQIQPLILVGIENTERRRDLTGPTVIEKDKEIAPLVGGSAAFFSFIQHELFPMVDRRYRTNGTKGIIGESLAGLFVTETFLLHPQTFDHYIAFDASLWWNDQHLLKNTSDHLADFPEGDRSFWFAASGAREISATISQLGEKIEKVAPEGLRWLFVYDKRAFHHTIFRDQKEEALIWTFK